MSISSNLLNLRGAIATWAGTQVNSATVSEHAGAFDLATITAHNRLPAILVSVMGCETELQGHELVGLPEIVLFILAKDAPSETRDELAISIAEYIAQQIPRLQQAGAFGVTGAQRVSNVSLRNLFAAEKDRRIGIALWSVAFTMSVPLLGLAAPVSDLDSMHVTYETVDGAEAADIINLGE
jgi:hypothetical protein